MPRPVGRRAIGVTGAALLLAVAGGAAAASTPAAAAGSACPPEIIQLPGLADSSNTEADAMNDKGTVVGVSYPAPISSRTERLVKWTNGDAPVDLGLVFERPTPGVTVYRTVVDVNNHGLIALEDEQITGNSKVTGLSGELRRGNEVMRLRGTSTRPFAVVKAVNDSGTAVGYIGSDDVSVPAVPVVWRRDGTLVRLPVPRADRQGSSGAEDINNRGLIIGEVGKQSRPTYSVAWWRLNGKNGRLQPPKDTYVVEAHFVDNRGHVVGYRPDWTFWRTITSHPRKTTFGYEVDIAALSDQGQFVSLRYSAADQRVPQAFIGHIGPPDQQATLPNPPGGTSVSPTTDIGQGVTAYAPQGGVTESGTVEIQDSQQGPEHDQAVLWTCAQTYLNM